MEKISTEASKIASALQRQNPIRDLFCTSDSAGKPMESSPIFVSLMAVRDSLDNPSITGSNLGFLLDNAVTDLSEFIANRSGTTVNRKTAPSAPSAAKPSEAAATGTTPAGYPSFQESATMSKKLATRRAT